jgi:hypothetical protein
VTGLSDAGTDPAAYLLAAADQAETEAGALSIGEPGRRFNRPGDDEWLGNLLQAQAALWRAVVAAESCFGKEYRPVADAAVGAARAYLTGAGG